MFVPGGSFFVWVGRDEWGEGRTVSLPAGRLQGLSFLVVCREGRGIGAVVDALWGSVASALWWMQWNEVLAVFVEGFLLTFDGGVVILKIHIWEHSGPFGYLIPIWLVV